MSMLSKQQFIIRCNVSALWRFLSAILPATKLLIANLSFSTLKIIFVGKSGDYHLITKSLTLIIIHSAPLGMIKHIRQLILLRENNWAERSLDTIRCERVYQVSFHWSLLIDKFSNYYK